MAEELFAWAAKDAEDAGKMLAEFRATRTTEESRREEPAGLRAIMVLNPPSGFTPGRCGILVRDPLFPFVYEISVVGFPNFSGLSVISGTINGAPWAFPWNIPGTAAVNGFPPAIRGFMRIAGGAIIDETAIYQTGRFYVGFSEQPLRFTVATTGSEACEIRAREVPFILSPVLRNFYSVADVTVPTAIAPGALGFAGYVPGLGLSILSVEPRSFTPGGGS